MVVICQQCGDIGYADLLVYCFLCHKAARHQYCLNMISELDEDIEWLCEDCNCSARKEKCVNNQYVEKSSNDLCLSSKENIISNENRCANELHCARKNKNRSNLHGHKHETRASGNTNKRPTRTMKFALESYNDSLSDEVTISQPFKCPQRNDHQRKLILPVEDDELLDGLAKGSSINTVRRTICLHQSLKKDEHNDMLDKENEDNNLEGKSLKKTKASNEIEVLGVKSFIQNTTIDDVVATKAKSKSEDNSIKLSYDVPLRVHLRDSPRSKNEFNDDVLAMPINWRGWFKIGGRVYGPMIAHLSPKIGEKAWKAARFLPQVIQLTMISRSRGWPRNIKNCPLTGDHIALIFFPPDSRMENKVDQLVQEVIRGDLMLKVALDEAELLIFPSNLLPETYKRYQDKHYLWGVFKSKESDGNTGELRLGQTYGFAAKQTVSNSIKSQEAQIERDDEKMSLEGDEPHLTDKGGKQTALNMSVNTEEVQIKKLCPLRDEIEDIGMDNDLTDEEQNGCLELFPMQVEDIALRLKMGDGEGIHLELSLGLPFRQ